MDEIRKRVDNEDNAEEVEDLQKYILGSEITYKTLSETQEKNDNEFSKSEIKQGVLEDEYDEGFAKLQDHVSKVKEIRLAIRRLLNQKKDKMNFFNTPGNDMMKILRLIGKTKFERNPIGPLFLYLNVVDQRWSAAVENFLRGCSSVFLVHSKRDSETLKKIFAKIWNGRRPDIIVFPFVDRNYELDLNKKVPDRYRILDDLLLISLDLSRENDIRNVELGVVEATIRTYLIDYYKSERVIIVEDRKEMERIFFRERPANAIRGLSINGSVCERLYGKEFLSSRNVGEAEFFGSEGEINLRIEEEKRKVLEEQKEEKNCRRELNIKKGDKEQNNKKLSSLKTESRQLRGKRKDLENKIGRMKERLEEFQESDDVDEGNKKAELDEQKKQIEKSEKNIEDIQERIKNTEREIEELNPELKRMESSIMVLKNSRREIDEFVEKLTEKASNKEKEIQEIRREEREVLESLVRKKIILKVLEEKKKSLQEDAEKSKKDDTDEFPERPKIGIESIEVLEERAAVCERRINNETSRLRGRNHEQVRREYNQELRNYNQIKVFLEVGEENFEIIKKCLVDRAEKWRKKRNECKSVSSNAFNMILSQRAHSGRLDYNNHEKKLMMVVNLNSIEDKQKRRNSDPSKEKRSRDTRILSGGEKSFSTLAFIISLWEIAETPFRCYDELDIFMDNVYRKVSLDVLIKCAMNKKHRDTQLIIITPQSTRSLIKSGKKNVHVIKMKDPLVLGMRQSSMEDFMN